VNLNRVCQLFRARRRSTLIGIVVLLAGLPAVAGHWEDFDAAEAARRANPDTGWLPLMFKAAQAGNPLAQYQLGAALLNSGDPEGQGRDLIVKSAESGFPPAMVSLGKLYQQGTGVPEDYSRAMSLYAGAARSGYAVANFLQYWLARSGQLGEAAQRTAVGHLEAGAKVGGLDSLAWLCLNELPKGGPAVRALHCERVANSDHALAPRAQNQLAMMYAFGDGVPKDFVLAYNWSNLAAARLDPDKEIKDAASAANLRDRLSEVITPTERAEAQRMAREWKPTIVEPQLAFKRQ
jgi:TPR repeat protein